MAQNKMLEVKLRALGEGDAIQERRVRLSADYPITIGRASSHRGVVASADNTKIENPVISKEHALLRTDSTCTTVFIKDLKSMHGTRVNGRDLPRGEEWPLFSGSELQFGTSVIRGKETYQPAKYRFESSLLNHPDLFSTTSEMSRPVPDTQDCSDIKKGYTASLYSISDEEFDDPKSDQGHSRVDIVPDTFASSSKIPLHDWTDSDHAEACSVESGLYMGYQESEEYSYTSSEDEQELYQPQEGDEGSSAVHLDREYSIGGVVDTPHESSVEICSTGPTCPSAPLPQLTAANSTEAAHLTPPAQERAESFVKPMVQSSGPPPSLDMSFTKRPECVLGNDLAEAGPSSSSTSAAWDPIRDTTWERETAPKPKPESSKTIKIVFGNQAKSIAENSSKPFQNSIPEIVEQPIPKAQRAAGALATSSTTVLSKTAEGTREGNAMKDDLRKRTGLLTIAEPEARHASKTTVDCQAADTPRSLKRTADEAELDSHTIATAVTADELHAVSSEPRIDGELISVPDDVKLGAHMPERKRTTSNVLRRARDGAVGFLVGGAFVFGALAALPDSLFA